MGTISANVVGIVLYAVLAVCVSLWFGGQADDLDSACNYFFCSLIVFGVVAMFMFVPFTSTPCHDADCQCIECHAHASDCQCNQCVTDRCNSVNHGDTCQCDKCIACKDIGGN